MFDKNSMRPAMAVACSACGQAFAASRRNEAMMYSGAAETEDFNSFNSFSEHTEPKQRQQKKRAPKKGGANKALIIGAIAAAAVVLLLTVVVLFALSGGQDITYTDNTYVAYADGDGNYHVAVNGSVVDFVFEGEVQVIPSVDRSFAYVTDTGLEGIEIYILNGKELEPVTSSPASEVLAYAGLKPGVIFKENGKFYLYSEKTGEERITSDSTTEHMMISADASTVSYTVAVEDSAGETYLCIYQDGSSNKVLKNCVPVAVSTYGDYVYGSTKDAEGRDVLNVVHSKDETKVQIENSNGFIGITAMNVKGNEVLFCVSNGADCNTYLYSMKEERSISLAKYMLSPATVDPDIAIYDTFKGVYLQGTNLDGTRDLTGYVTKKLEWKNIARAIGQFESEGQYFYYIDDEMTLRQLDLTEKNYPKVRIDDDVIDFTLTEKGNVYSLNDDNQLRFYKVSTKKKTRVSDDATEISIYNYANEVYFSEAEAVDVSVFTSKEGGEKKIAELDSNQIGSVPYFSDTNSKKCYAYYYDLDYGWRLFYTSNGKSFKLISDDCQALNGVALPESGLE